MNAKAEKWWAWQGLNLRPLRCQHSGYRRNARESAVFSFRDLGTGAERSVIRRQFYRSFTARPNLTADA